MKHTLRSALAWLIALGLPAAALGADEILLIGNGELRTLSSLPEKASLRGAGQLQQLVITGHYANGGIRDLTRQVKYRTLDPQMVRVDANGLMSAVKNGTTEVIAEVEGKSVKVAVQVEGADREQPINFTNEIVPIFSKLGCNSGACHGKSTGQNGFRLSLLGFEPAVDFDALAREGRERRITSSAPEASLVLRKPSGAMPHGGGKRLDPTSRDYLLLLRWIRAGAPLGQNSDPRVVGLVVNPAHRLAPAKSSLQITVTALMSDGSRRDVTADAEYSSNTPEIAAVSEGGLVETLDIPGDGAVMVRYLGHVGVFRVTVPQEAPLEKYTFPPPANYIDEHVLAKLKQLGVPPSGSCSDSEFLRRVSLDITGTLPTAQEAEKFLADTDPTRRARLVDELLKRPAYASFFALKWGDILRNRRDGLVGVGGKQERTHALHGWLVDAFAKNKAYDQFAREVLTATGDFSGAGASLQSAGTSSCAARRPWWMTPPRCFSEHASSVLSATTILTRSGARTIIGAWLPTPNEHNQKDKQNYARFHPRRLSAEVLFDAFDQVAGAPVKFASGKGGPMKTPATRAIELPDEAVKTPLLMAFGKPERSSACECERSGAATLTQSLYLIASTELHGKLKDKAGRAALLALDPRPAADKIRELYLWAFARLPAADESNTVQAYLTAGGNRKEAYEDLIWALLNTKEFLFNH